MLLFLVVHVLAAIRRCAAALRVLSRAQVPGQGLVEYGLVLVLIMVVCVAVVGATGQTISSVWYNKLLPAFP
ncbi:MAG TPA: hypothetical protein VFT66_07645 [Roseiflexaceae bacterium]|jgi:hypothetical protein|nr:hypothetical protein [Roseiflexaceae bacterium]